MQKDAGNTHPSRMKVFDSKEYIPEPSATLIKRKGVAGGRIIGARAEHGFEVHIRLLQQYLRVVRRLAKNLNYVWMTQT